MNSCGTETIEHDRQSVETMAQFLIVWESCLFNVEKKKSHIDFALN